MTSGVPARAAAGEVFDCSAVDLKGFSDGEGLVFVWLCVGIEVDFAELALSVGFSFVFSPSFSLFESEGQAPGIL